MSMKPQSMGKNKKRLVRRYLDKGKFTMSLFGNCWHKRSNVKKENIVTHITWKTMH